MAAKDQDWRKSRQGWRAAAMMCALSAAACAPLGAHSEKSPDWFKARAQEAEHKPFPKLASVPDLPQPTRPAHEWSAIEADVNQAGSALKNSPRSAASTEKPADAAAFENKARQDAGDKSTPAQ